MSIEKTGSATQHGLSAQSGGNAVKRAVSSNEAEDFASGLKSTKADAQGVQENNKEDLQALLSLSLKQSIATTSRLIQENAKDIERENIDKGF